MFNKKRLLFPLAVLFLFIGGCDFLKTKPKGEIYAGNFWRTEEDARLAVNDLYNYLYSYDIFAWDSMSDIATANRGFVATADYIRGIQTAQSGYSNDQWYRNYRGIGAANRFLENVEHVESKNQQLIERYKAEARFIRAYLYTYLTFWFGDVPLITKPLSLEEAEKVTRTDRKKVWDFIASEFQEISKVLPVSYSGDNLGRITKGAALAMKARAMLWAGRYSEAAEAAKAVMDLGVYSLYPSYEKLFSYQAEHNQEVILNREFLVNEDPGGVFGRIGPASQHGANSDYVPTKKIVDAYEMKNGLPIDDPDSGYDPRHPYQNRDPRLDYSIFVYGDTLPNGQIYDPRPGFRGADDITDGVWTTKTGFNIEKYVNPEDLDTPFNTGINIILIRYAEVLLTYAEGKIEAGMIDQSVYDAINKVRQRADVDMPPIEPPKTQEELRQIVRHERMVELAFEGLRFFDVRRWGIADEVLNGPIYGLTYETKEGELETWQFLVFQRHFTDTDYLWPLPKKEVELTGMRQNPGY